jgi:hypothetical protein
MIVKALKIGFIYSVLYFIGIIIFDYLKLSSDIVHNMTLALRTVLTIALTSTYTYKSKTPVFSIALFQFLLMMLITAFVLISIWEWIYRNIF